MKRQLAIALGLAVVSTSALASKARLESLGQDANGSQVIEDHRSIFLNAAHLNHHKDFVLIEVGNTSSQTSADQDGRTTPKAEGGVFKSAGNMVYGIYMGEESNTANGLRAAAGLTDTQYAEQNSTTLFVAGDAGVQWGASLTHQAYKNEQSNSKDETSAMRARLGAISGNIDAFANIGLTNKAEDGTKEFKGKSSYDLGVTYSAASDVQYMLRVNAIDAEDGASGSFKGSSMAIGASKSYKLNDKAMMWAQAWYTTSSKKCDGQFDLTGYAACGAANAEELKTTALPVTVSLEVDANDWLALRGFIAKNVFIGNKEDKDGDKVTVDGLNQGVGASFKYGDLTVDGSLILTNQSADDNNVGTLNLAQPMNRVSLTYNF